MSRTTRQSYIDTNLEAARAAGCDCIQLKYDGWWSRFELSGHDATCYSRTERELTEQNFKSNNKITATIIGELMYGTNWSQDTRLQGKVYVFDVWSLDGVDLSDVPYRDRYAIARALCKQLPNRFILVNNFNITDRPQVWNTFVEQGDFEGVIYRSSRAPVNAPVYREKSVAIATYTAVGFQEGEGKFAGTLGAVLCHNEKGVEAAVGGGFSNEDRAEVWANQDKFFRRQMEVEGRKRFAETGLLRHPNFVRWL